MSVEHQLFEHGLLNYAFRPKIHLNKYKLNINYVNNIPIEQSVNLLIVNWT